MSDREDNVQLSRQGAQTALQLEVAMTTVRGFRQNLGACADSDRQSRV